MEAVGLDAPQGFGTQQNGPPDGLAPKQQPDEGRQAEPEKGELVAS